MIARPRGRLSKEYQLHVETTVMSEYAYLWEYRVRPDRIREFEAAYGPTGEWAQLFRRAPGYLGTELLRDNDLAGRYLTVDHWESREACDAFRQRFGAEFQALDERCEQLTESETPLGSFSALD